PGRRRHRDRPATRAELRAVVRRRAGRPVPRAERRSPMMGTAEPAAAAAGHQAPAPARGLGAGPAVPVIEATRLAAGYPGRTVWSGADFSVGAGEFLAVRGPNGAGKSTRLRMVLGLLRPAQGTLRVFGDPPRRGNPAIGYVPQRRTLDPDLGIRAADLVGL